MIEAIKHFLGIGEEAAGRRTAAAIGLLMFAAIGAAGLAGAMLSGTDCTPNAPDPNCSSDLSPTLSPPMSPPMSPPVTPTTTTTTVDATSTTAAPTTTLLPTTTSTTASTTSTTPAPTTTLAPLACVGAHALDVDHTLRSGDPAVTEPFSVPAGSYQVQLTSTGANHQAGSMTDQTSERWRIELLDADGNVLAVSASISDLPDDQTQLSESVGFLTIASDATTIALRHTGATNSVNSITADCVVLNQIESVPTPVIVCAGNPQGVPIGEHLVAGDQSNKVNTNFAAGSYNVTLVSADAEHRAGYQLEQTNETWRLDFLDSTGAVLASTASTLDLGEVENQNSTPVGTVGLEATATHVRAVHTGINVNSVTAVCASVTPV